MTTATTELPPAKDVRDLIEGLLGKDTDLSDGLRATGPAVLVGTYVDDSLRLRALVVLDLAMAAHTGAAIGLMPPGAAQDALEDGVLPPLLRDNAAEVLNVMASLFNVGGAPHLRLYTTHAPGEALPGDVAGHVAALGGRADWTVAVKGYGRGQLSIVLT